jgi:hypothetical protein
MTPAKRETLLIFLREAKAKAKDKDKIKMDPSFRWDDD